MQTGISRQVPLSDLYKASTQQREEIHQLMGEIEMPDESLTISSMSQSPFQAKYRQNLSNTNGTQEQSNDNEGTLGRSELEAFSNNDINKTTTNKSLSTTQRNDASHSYIEEDEYSQNEIDPDNDISQEDARYVNNRVNQRRHYKQHQQDTTNEISLDETDQDHQSQGGRDSPYFNKHNNNNNGGNSTVDLTISQTVISNQNTTHRGGILEPQNTKRGSTNRTFADSVLNHQYAQYTSSSNNNSHRNQVQYNNLESQRHPISRRNYRTEEGGLVSTDENMQDSQEDSQDELTQDREDDISKEDIDPSDQSAIESFTQHSKYTTSRMGLSRFMGRPDDMASKRSPAINKRDDDSSSLSPSPIGNDHHWLSQTKSYINNNKKSINRTAGSDNPMNKLTTNLPQILNNQLTNRTQTNVQWNNKHNRSLQRDPELEQALEEDSQNQTLQRFNTLEESKELLNDNEIGNRLVKKPSNLGFKYSKLKIKNQAIEAQLAQIANECEQRDNEVGLLRNECFRLQEQLDEKEDHIKFLQHKFKDDSSLPQLRTKNLNLAKNEINKLTQDVKAKDDIIQQLEQELRKRQTEDQIYEMATQQEISKLNQEIETLKILGKGKQRDVDMTSQKYIQMLNEQEQHFLNLLKEREEQIQLFDKAVKDLKKSTKNKENEMKDYQQQIQDLSDVLDQKDKMFTQCEQSKDKYMNEMKNFKERCKQLEQELEQTKGFENNSMFMNNVSYSNATNQNSKKNDYEFKQMREVYEKKLNKATEEVTQKSTKMKELELECRNVKEELKKIKELQISSTSEKFEKDKELINELRDTKQEVTLLKQTEEDIRICFNMQPKEDIVQKLTNVCQDLETIPLLERELDRMKVKLEDAQKQLIENQSNNKGQGQEISNFMKNILFQKDQQLEDIQRNYESERDLRSKSQEELYSLQSQLKNLTSTNSELQFQLSTLQQELQKTKESKDKQDKNVDELKEKLRVMIREQQELTQSQQKASKQPYQDESLRRKYEELVELILQVNLASDPLESANISLQESFIDECEQAKKHMNDQVKLVSELIQRQEKDKQELADSIRSLENQSKEKISNMTSLKVEVSKLNDQVRDKERQLEVLTFEFKELTERCERLTTQQKQSEEYTLKLKQELDQSNLNLRKVMRTQEHLHKDHSKKMLPTVAKSQPEEQERAMMSYEDGMSKMAGRVDKLSDQQIIKTRELYRNEVIDMFDRLIDSNNTKMPTFNELALQLSSRIDKVRSQERMKHNNEQHHNQPLKSLKSSQSGENCMVETFKQEMDSINNEDELAKSLAKWMKQSQNNNFNQQLPNKNYFQNEDNNSLMFSELIVAAQQQQQQQKPVNDLLITQKDQQIETLNFRITELEQEIQTKQTQVEDLSELMKEQGKQIRQMQDELRIKESSLRDSEEQFNLKTRDYDDQLRSRNQQMWKEVEMLKDQIRQELTQKTQKLDQEYDELQAQKTKQREQLSKQQQELEVKYSLKIDTQEKEFLAKLKQMETDIKSSHEKSKDELLSNVYKQLEEQYQNKIKQIQEDHASIILAMKAENNSKIEDLKRVKEREVKKIKEEIERIRKASDEKLKKLEMEWLSEKECIERENNQKVETLTQKNKKDLKSACDKVRAEMRNQIDSIKNEMQKLKIDQERDRKKLIQEHQNALELQTREFEDKLDQEVKQVRLQCDKASKRKLEDKEKECSKRLQDMDQEFALLSEAQQENLVKDRERLEILLKEQLKNELRIELSNKFEDDYNQQLCKIKQQNQQELERIRDKYEQIEQISQIPTLVKDQRDAQVQCFFQDENEWDKQSMHSMQSRQESSIVSIEHMRERFEEEMDRQKEIFEVQLIAKQSMSVRIFEEIMTLEFDKILHSIFHKSQSSNTTTSNNSAKLLEQKRRDINNLITDILNRNDDRKERQMRSSLDNLKKKISEVLKIFKQELENKLNKKMSLEMQEMKRELQDKGANMIDIQEELRAKLKIQNMSEIISKEDDDSIYSSRSKAVITQNNSRMPTPRNIDMSLRQHTDRNESDKKQNQQQFSDIKQYISEEQEENANQVLRKITPIANSKGVLVVEVEKVVRDLKMLFSTIKQAKFYRLLINIEDLTQHASNQAQDQIDEERGNNNDASLQIYRQLLNDFFKSIIKLNNGAEQMGKQSEVYKLKLMNADLREQITKMQEEYEVKKVHDQVETILNYYSQRSQQLLSSDAQQCLQLLENTQFIINKQQFKLYQLIDLFTVTDNLNTNSIEVNQNCKAFSQQYPLDMENNQDLLIQSQYSPDKVKIQPEMLSPEETAQLIANVFQKLNQTSYYNQTNANNNNQQFDMYSSFFQTFLSNEDYIKNAENFIQKYREQLNYTQKYKNMPLQATSKEAFSRTNATTQRPYQSVQVNNTINKKRCKSQTNANSSCQLPLQQPHFQSYVSNVFQSNLMEKQSSVHSYQPILINNYDTQSQNSQVNNSYIHNNKSTILASNNGKANHPYQSIQNKNLSVEEVSSTQSNVNLLFERLKNNFLGQ